MKGWSSSAKVEGIKSEKVVKEVNRKTETINNKMNTIAPSQSKSSLAVIANSNSTTNLRKSLGPSSPTPGKKSMRSTQYHHNTPAPKLLTLNHLKTLLKDLIASKQEHDQKCQAAGLPLETLEQHLYTFLTTRFGLKSLVVEWAESVVAGISQFAADDHDVALMGKILQNEIDEDFRIVQTEVKRTLTELLKVPKGSTRFKSEMLTLKNLKNSYFRSWPRRKMA